MNEVNIVRAIVVLVIVSMAMSCLPSESAKRRATQNEEVHCLVSRYVEQSEEHSLAEGESCARSTNSSMIITLVQIKEKEQACEFRVEDIRT